MQSDAVHAFENHLRYDATLPIQWEKWRRNEDTLEREIRLKRSLGVLAAQTAFDERRSEPGEDIAQLAPELLRLDAKLNHLIDLVGALLSRSSPSPAALPVSINSWGVAWRAEGDVPDAGAEVLMRVHLDANSALPLELSATLAAPIRRDGVLWQLAVFHDLGDVMSDAIERLVFRMHRRQLADERSTLRE